MYLNWSEDLATMSVRTVQCQVSTLEELMVANHTISTCKSTQRNVQELCELIRTCTILYSCTC